MNAKKHRALQLALILIVTLLAALLPAQTTGVTGDSTINQCETKAYSISVLNNSGNPLTQMIVTAKLVNLTGFSYVSGTASIDVNGGAAFCTANPVLSGSDLVWNIDTQCGGPFTLNNGSTLNVTFSLVTSCAAVSGSLNVRIDYRIGGTPMFDDTGVHNIQVQPGAVSIKKTPNVIPQEIGQNVTWTLTVENTGFGTIKNVVVNDLLGAGLAYVSSSPAGSNSGQQTTWGATEIPLLASLDPGQTVSIDITATVTACELLDNKADVRWGCDAVTDCFNTAADGGTATASVQRIVKTPLIVYTPPDITFTYCEDYVDVSFTISNIGDGRAHSVWTLVDFAPLTVSNVSAGTIYNNTDKRFEHADPILPGGNYVLSFRLSYASWCGGTFPAKNLVWQKMYEDDCHQLFYPPVALSTINPPLGSASVTVNKAGAGAVIQIGDAIAYTITSAYTGPLSCGSGPGSTGIMTVVDTIPNGFIVIDADGGTYVPGGGGTGGTITWTYTPPATLSRTITVQSPTVADCETYCNTTFANNVSVSGVDCCGCSLSASASETSAIECHEGVTSEKTASGPSERCSDTTYANTYIFDAGSSVNLNNLIFTEHAENQQLYNDNLTITLDGSDISASAIVTDTTPGGSLVINFSGAPATSLAGKTLVISYNLTATANTVAACGGTTFYSWSSLSMGSNPGSNCLQDGVIHETIPVTIGSPAMAVSLSGLGAIFHKCQTQTITMTLRQTSSFNPKDVKLVLSGLNYYVIDHTNPAAITCSGDVTPIACLPTVDGSGNYVWTFNDLFTGQNQTASIVFNVQKRCNGSGDLTATAYFDDRCTDDATSDELCSATATATPTLLLSGDLLIEKTPEVYYATTNTVQWVIFLTNRGTGTAYNVWLDDVLGAGLQYSSAVVDDMTGVTVTGNLDHSGTVINGATIAISDMTAGERRMITFTATVIDCADLTNLATASWGCVGLDCQVAVSDTSTVKIPAPNLINTNTITPSSGVNACASPAGFITLRNAGQVTCYNLQVTETLPAGLLYVSGTSRWRLNGGGWNGPNVSYDPVPTTSPLVWTKAQIPGLATANPGDTIEIEFEMISDCPFSGGDITVSTRYENPCADVFTNAASKFTVAYHAPVITVTKTRLNAPIDCNQDITWDITVTNNSGYVMPIIWVEDTMDAAYTYVSSTGNAPYTSDNGTQIGQKVSWELGNVPTGTTVNLTLTAHTDTSPCSPDLDNTVRAWWGCGNADGSSATKPGIDPPDTSLCLGSIAVSAVRTETRQPTVGYVSIALSPGSINSCNDNTVMTLTIANTGVTDARNVDLVVTLPAGLSYNAGSSLLCQGVDDTCTAVGIGDPAIAGNVLTYYDIASKLTNLTNILQAVGGNDTLVLKFSVKSSCYMTQNVGLNLRYYDCCDDTQYSTSTNQPVISLFPSLSITKTPVSTASDCGTAVTWTVAVTNNGTGNAQVVRVEDTLGDWLTYVPGSFTTPDKPGTSIANLGGQVWAWEFNDLAAGASASFTLGSTLNPVGSPNQADCTTALRQNNVRAIWGCGTAGDATDNNPATIAYDCTTGTWSAAPVTTVLMPDLRITAITPGIACTTGDGVFSGSVSVTVQNQGTAPTLTGFTISVTDGTWTGTGSTGVLAAGASVTVTIDASDWAINCHGCTPYTLDAIADSTTAVCECNEANNTSTLSYTPPLPDLKVNSITPTCTADGRLRVRVNISNVGCASSGTFVLALQDDQGHSSTSNQAILAAGASRNVDFTNWVSACSPATVNFTATVDSTNTNCECDADNSLTYVYNNTLPNLVISAITSATSCASDGSISGTISVQVSNTGNGPVSNDFRILVNDGQGWTSQPWYNATLGGTLPIAAGSNATVTIPWTRGFTTAPYTCSFPTITVTLDTTSVICECSNASNAATSSYAMTYPNLRITSVTPTCSNDGTYSVAVVVNNNGCGAATNVVVRLSDNDGQSADQTVTLAAGASQTLTYAPWPADGNPASLTFTTTLDPGSAICELSGTDNTNSTTFSRGNLNLLSITPACNADGTFQVSLVIQNSGSADINNNFIVRLSDNDGHSLDQNFTAIGGTLPFAAGSQQTVTFNNWVVDCAPTTINFSGTLDPTNLVCESNNSDNTGTGVITISDLQAVSVVPATACASDGTITGTLAVTVANTGGNAINTDFSILVDDGQGWTSELFYNADLGGTLPIAVGASQSVTFNWTRGFSATPYVCSFPSIGVTVDSQNAICECSSSNNTGAASYSMSYPNLNVVSVTPTCNSDSSYSITVVVNNNGCGTAANVVVRLSDNDGQTADQTVTLAPGASSTLTYASWPADGNPAALTFTATIDPAAAICELTGDDHTEIMTYNIPNLRLVSITPACVADGSYSVAMVIENNGAGAVTNDFIVRLSDNDGHSLDQNFTAIGGTLPFAAGSQQTVTFNNWVVDCAPTTINFNATLDPTNLVCESNSGDNTNTGTITINDLQAVSVVPATICASDGTITGTMAVTVANNGGNAINADFRILVDDGQGWTSELFYNADLGGTLPIAPGASSSATFNWTRAFTATPYGCGFPAISVTVDSQNAICECTDANNQTSSTYTLPFPDLTITAVASAVVCLGDGSLTGTTITVANTGCATANNVVVRLTSDCGLTFSDQTVDLAAGENRDLFFTFIAGITNCTCNFSASIDPDNVICELDGGNNTNTSTLPLTIPDIEVEGENLNAACSNDGSITVGGTFSLVNNGCGPALTAPIGVRFTLYSESDCRGSVLDQWTQVFSGVNIAALGGSQSFSVQAHELIGNSCSLSPDCRLSVRIEADYDQRICEWDGTDNDHCANLDLACLDLAFSDVSWQCDPAGAITWTVQVTNSGNSAADNALIRIYDESPAMIFEQRVSIAAGATVTIPFTSNAYPVARDHSFRLVIDENNEICECNGQNNIRLVTVNCPFLGEPRLEIRKTCPPAQQPGGIYRFEIEIRNSGEGSMEDVQIEDVLPTPLQYVSGSSALDGTPFADPSGTTVLTWKLGKMAAGETHVLVYSLIAPADAQPGRYCNQAQAWGTALDGKRSESEKTTCCIILRREAGGCCLVIDERPMGFVQFPELAMAYIEPYFHTEKAMFASYAALHLWENITFEQNSLPDFVRERLKNYALANVEELYFHSSLGLTLPDGSLWLSYAGNYPQKETGRWKEKNTMRSMTPAQLAFELLAMSKAALREEKTESKEKLNDLIAKKIEFIASQVSRLPKSWKFADGRAVRQKEKADLYDLTSLYLSLTELGKAGWKEAAVLGPQLRRELASLDNEKFDSQNLRQEFLFILALKENGETERAVKKISAFERLFRDGQCTPADLPAYAMAVYTDFAVGGTISKTLFAEMKSKFYLGDIGLFAEPQADFKHKIDLESLAPLILAFESQMPAEKDLFATTLYRTIEETGLFLKKTNLQVQRPPLNLIKNYPFTQEMMPLLTFIKSYDDMAPIFSETAMVQSPHTALASENLLPVTYTKVYAPQYETDTAQIGLLSFSLQHLAKDLDASAERVLREQGRSLDHSGKKYVRLLLAGRAGLDWQGNIFLPTSTLAVKGAYPQDMNLEPLDSKNVFSTDVLANKLVAEKIFLENPGRDRQRLETGLKMQNMLVSQFKAAGFVPARFTAFKKNETGELVMLPKPEKADKMTIAKLQYAFPDLLWQQLLEKETAVLKAQDLLFLTLAPQSLQLVFEKDLRQFLSIRADDFAGIAAQVLACRILKLDTAPTLKKLADIWDHETDLPLSSRMENMNRGQVYHYEPWQILVYLLATKDNADFKFKRTLDYFTYLLESEWGMNWSEDYDALPAAEYWLVKESPREYPEPGDLLNFNVRVENRCPNGLASAGDLPSLFIKAEFTPSLVFAGTELPPDLNLFKPFSWGYQNLEKDSYLQYTYQVLIPREFTENYLQGNIWVRGYTGYQPFGPDSASGEYCENFAQTARLQLLPQDLIPGLVYADRNLNGRKDAGETGIAAIRFKDNRGRIFRSNAEGRFTVPAGQDNVAVQIDFRSIPENLVLISPPTQLTNRAQRRELIYALVPCHRLQGFVYQDNNRNGVHDEGEPRLAGIMLKAGDKECSSGSNGEFLMSNLPDLWRELLTVDKNQNLYSGSLAMVKIEITNENKAL